MTTLIDDCETLNMLQRFGQQHLLQFWNELTEKERCQLMKDIENIDFETFLSDVEIEKKRFEAKTTTKIDDMLLPPTPDICGSWADSSATDIERYYDIGIQSIADGECAVVLMAGGAGTRLGVNYPKGMYDVGLPSGKSLFQMQAESIIRLQKIASQKFGTVAQIMWYIMTSDNTYDATMDYFTRNNFFGLLKDQVVLFAQFTLPVIGLDGKILLESKYQIAKSPDGNGGLYRALRNHKIIDDMTNRGIKYVHVYGVDNILIKIADPIFTGFVVEKEVECAAKVVKKINAAETVGIIAQVNDHYQVVEYSEMAKETSELRDPEDNGKLVYRYGSICNHLFHMNFLQRVCNDNSSNDMVQHIALKAVPYINTMTGVLEVPTKINAIKLEKFVFDVFPLAKSFVIWEVEREQEFSALKNAPGSKVDCPETSRMSVLKYHNYLVRSSLRNCENIPKALTITFEISPLLSYRGEGLDKLDRCVEKAKEGSTVLLELKKDNKMTMKNTEERKSNVALKFLNIFRIKSCWK